MRDIYSVYLEKLRVVFPLFTSAEIEKRIKKIRP